MHKYMTQEGQLTFLEPFLDTTVNVLRFPKSQTALVISRSQVIAEQDIMQFFEEQMAILKNNMPHFKVTKKGVFSTVLYDNMVLAESNYLQGSDMIYQRSYLAKNNNHFIVYTFSKNSELEEKEKKIMDTYIQNITDNTK